MPFFVRAELPEQKFELIDGIQKIIDNVGEEKLRRYREDVKKIPLYKIVRAVLSMKKIILVHSMCSRRAFAAMVPKKFRK